MHQLSKSEATDEGGPRVGNQIRGSGCLLLARLSSLPQCLDGPPPFDVKPASRFFCGWVEGGVLTTRLLLVAVLMSFRRGRGLVERARRSYRKKSCCLMGNGGSGRRSCRVQTNAAPESAKSGPH